MRIYMIDRILYCSHPAQLVSRKEKVNSLLRGLNEMSKGVAVLAPGCTKETDLIATIGPLFNASVVSAVHLYSMPQPISLRVPHLDYLRILKPRKQRLVSALF